MIKKSRNMLSYLTYNCHTQRLNHGVTEYTGLLIICTGEAS